jgi:hypothetical protein
MRMGAGMRAAYALAVWRTIAKGDTFSPTDPHDPDDATHIRL